MDGLIIIVCDSDLGWGNQVAFSVAVQYIGVVDINLNFSSIKDEELERGSLSVSVKIHKNKCDCSSLLHKWVTITVRQNKFL